MRISTIRDFRDRATRLMREEEPLLVTRRGRLSGVFLPWTADTLPADLMSRSWSPRSIRGCAADLRRSNRCRGRSAARASYCKLAPRS